MLIKLFKHEFRATGRIFLPLYALLAVFSVINKILPSTNSVNSIFSGILVVVPVVLYVCIIVALSAMTLVALIQRFSKSLLGDEGYLSHTLPVQTWQHIACKLLTSACWTLLSTFVITLSVLFMAADVGHWGELWNDFQTVLISAGEFMGVSGITAFWAFLGMVFLIVIKTTLMIYASMGIGQCFARHKVAFSVLAAMVLSIAEQILMSGAMTLFARATRETTTAQELMSVLTAFTVGAVVFGAIYAFITNWTLKKRLNLA